METEAPYYMWRRTSGAAPDAVKAARPVLPGGREETCRKVTRLAPTQHHHIGKVLAYVFGRRQDTVFLEFKRAIGTLWYHALFHRRLGCLRTACGGRAA